MAQSRIWGNPMKASSGSSSYGKKELPLIRCPDCNVRVIKLRIKQPRSYNQIFYKCPNNIEDDATTCDLFMGEEYRNYLRLHRDLEGPAVLDNDIGMSSGQICELKEEIMCWGIATDEN
ncbi:hypothetical protein EJB05_28752 [Eragrostis curvula]|uniref:Zinc finger GRF-type domain-containing protein n=1 Tax=Eragrostis curvula TaxID=38414 RepID=A0A5J9URR9_9POAL|nr:hypothetical protein EJB05_28752 [Eragrostis curvula]